MRYRTQPPLVVRICVLFLVTAVLGPLSARTQAKPGQKQKLPKPRELDSGIIWHRDPTTGELHAVVGRKPIAGTTTLADSAPSGPAAIRSNTEMVAVTCMVATSDGVPVPGLSRGDFRIYDDGAEQQLAYFDASNEPASVAIVLDASPSVLRDSDEMKSAADALIEGLAPLDQAAVVDFAAHTYLQLSFSDVRELLRRAIDRVRVRELFSDTGGSNIYEAVYLTARDLFPGRSGRKAIVLLTDGQDSGLGLTLDPASAAPSASAPNKLTFDDLARLLASENVQVFAVSNETRPKVMTASWLASRSSETLLSAAVRDHIPPYTLYLAELVRRAGGQLYFLREAPTLADTFRQIARKIRAEYTLGYYPQPTQPRHRAQQPPATRPARAGWHSLRVTVPDQPNVTISYRAAYYVPASR
jgi:Ca-activated chloride channel homolog